MGRSDSEEEDWGPRVRWYSHLKGKTWAFLIAAVFFLTVFLHFREAKMEILELGTVAPRYVIAQVDFYFPDEEATQILRQESVRDIGTIYRIEDRQVHLYRHELENALIAHQDWRKELPQCTFEQLHEALSYVEEAMIRVRFTDERTLHRMRILGIPEEDFYITPMEETQLPPMALPKEFWGHLETRGFSETTVYVLHRFMQQLWNIEVDYVLERDIRGVVQASIPQKYTYVEAGDQIVRKGELVTSRHLCMLQGMKKASDQQKNLWTPLTLMGSFLMALALMGGFLLYFSIFQREFLGSVKKITLWMVIFFLTLGLSKGVEHFLLYAGNNLIEVARFPLLVPFASLMITILMGAEVALFTSFLLVVILRVSLAVDYESFILVNFLAALVTIFFARLLHRRKEVFAVCGKVWCALVPVFCAVNLIENAFWNFNLLGDLVSSFVFMTATAILAAGLLPILESLFHIMTDMMLMEYMDPNHPLLRRLSVEAPGTYQHCLVVGNLAEEAARAVGANGLFCRVATLYHDIGKLFNPHYFTENQLGGFNIHQLLTPLESTHVIIAHVVEGETLARKHRLPETFIDVIREHHGTTMVYCFYCKQVEQMGGDTTKVDEKLFRYPGPKPKSKESAIIMLADTFEAASRSMEEVSEGAIAEMIDRLVAEKTEDGQLNECRLTFEELGAVKRAMVRALVVARHYRIKYPEPRGAMPSIIS